MAIRGPATVPYSPSQSTDPQQLPKYKEVMQNIIVRTVTAKKKFLETVETALSKINSKPVGQRLITKIGKGAHLVVINYSATDNSAISRDASLAVAKGYGTLTDIFVSCQDRIHVGKTSPEIVCPFFAVLAHELIHAYHNSYGKHMTDSRGKQMISGLVRIEDHQDIWTVFEEHYTIDGMPFQKVSLAKPKITENAIRREHGLEERCSHWSAIGLSSSKSKALQKYARFERTASGVHNIGTSGVKRMGLQQKRFHNPRPLSSYKWTVEPIKK